jgi:hypothetical protein
MDRRRRAPPPTSRAATSTDGQTRSPRRRRVGRRPRRSRVDDRQGRGATPTNGGADRSHRRVNRDTGQAFERVALAVLPSNLSARALAISAWTWVGLTPIVLARSEGRAPGGRLDRREQATSDTSPPTASALRRYGLSTRSVCRVSTPAPTRSSGRPLTCGRRCHPRPSGGTRNVSRFRPVPALRHRYRRAGWARTSQRVEPSKNLNRTKSRRERWQ